MYPRFVLELKSNVVSSSWSKNIAIPVQSSLGNYSLQPFRVRRERDRMKCWTTCHSVRKLHLCIRNCYGMLPLCFTFLHRHVSLNHVHFFPVSLHGVNNANMGSFLPTKQDLFCVNCLYFSSIANRLSSHLLCAIHAFLQNEKIIDEHVHLQLLCAASIPRNWQNSKWFIRHGIWFFFLPFSMWTYYVRQKKREGRVF